MTVQATQAVVDFIVQMVRDPALAFQFAQNGHGTLAAQGITEQDLNDVDMADAINQACGTPGFPADAATALQVYTSGGGGGGNGYQPPSSSAPQTPDHVVQQLQYVNYVTHEDNTTIQQTIIDQSTSIDVDGDFHGDIDVDNAAATGDGAVAGGEGDVNAATGDNSQVVDDSTIGNNAVNSPGAVQAGGDIDAPVNTGVNTGVLADGDVQAPIVTGTNTGIVADGDVDDSVVGDHNRVANVDGENDGVINFGDGDVNNVNDSTLTDSNVGSGTNVTDNDFGDGSALSTGGNASGHFEDNDTTTTTTNTDNSVESNTVNAHDSVVTTEQGPGDQHSDADNHADDHNGLLFAQREPVHVLDAPDGGDGGGDQPDDMPDAS